jgi:hypothetical protein
MFLADRNFSNRQYAMGLVPSWWAKPLKELRLATFNARAVARSITIISLCSGSRSVGIRAANDEQYLPRCKTRRRRSHACTQAA